MMITVYSLSIAGEEYKATNWPHSPENREMWRRKKKENIPKEERLALPFRGLAVA